MGTRVNYSGFVVAGIGFFLTRFTVTLAIYEDPVRFYASGVVPLVLGLGLAAFGVALAVAEVDAAFVRTTATWCVVGTAGMVVLAVPTLLGSMSGGMPDPATVLSQTYLSNFLIGGSVGGTLTGLYAARNRRQRRDLVHQSNRLEVLNRLLRHEILNALTAIRGYAGFADEDPERARAVIESKSDEIAGTVEEVKYLTRSAVASGRPGGEVDIGACLDASAARVREQYPDARITVDSPPELAVLAGDRLERVFTHLFENAVVYTDGEPVVDVSVTETAGSVRVNVRDRGTGLPEAQQRLLETGDITEFDSPEAGYGLNVVRLLVESYEGTVETEVGPDGTTVTVVLPRARVHGTVQSSRSSLAGVRPALPQLVVTLGAALLAGVVYGLVAEQFGGSVGVIGVLYGAESTVVGWITHEFHSVVFGFVFAGLVSLAPTRYRTSWLGHVAIGFAWGLVLWFFAAGIVSAVWLRLLGIPAPIPSLSLTLLGSHLVWGVSLGTLTSLGYQHLTPWLEGVHERVGRVTAGSS